MVAATSSAADVMTEPPALLPRRAKTLALSDKHDAVDYTMRNLPAFALAGFATGAQEAFYAYSRMSAAETRNTLQQAGTLLKIVGRKTLYASVLGAIFTYTESTLETTRETRDIYNGMAAGAATGLFFSMVPLRPMPQPIVWPLTFALAAGLADVVSEYIPEGMRPYKTYGSVPGLESWGDPEPPRPPIFDTLGSAPPLTSKHFVQGP